MPRLSKPPEFYEDEASSPSGGGRRRRKSPTANAAHLARIERYRQLVEERGWIFKPPSPPIPLSGLLEYLTGKQIESLAG